MLETRCCRDREVDRPNGDVTVVVNVSAQRAIVLPCCSKTIQKNAAENAISAKSEYFRQFEPGFLGRWYHLTNRSIEPIGRHQQQPN